MPCRLATPLLAALLLAPGAPLGAEDFSDPDWPCIQRKVERLSPGLMWPVSGEPAPDLEPGTEAALSDLAAILALRRVDAEGMDAAIADFVTDHPHGPAVMEAAFLRVFDTLAARRGAIMAGIADYSNGQIDRADDIEQARQQMQAEMAKEAPDFDRVDALEEQIDWNERIHTERQQSLRYICETPILLEQRLYTIAQKLQFAVDG